MYGVESINAEMPRGVVELLSSACRDGEKGPGLPLVPQREGKSSGDLVGLYSCRGKREKRSSRGWWWCCGRVMGAGGVGLLLSLIHI